MPLRFEPYVSADTFLRYRDEQTPDYAGSLNRLGTTINDIGGDLRQRREYEAAKNRQAMLDRLLERENDYKYGRQPGGEMISSPSPVMGQSRLFPRPFPTAQAEPVQEALNRYRTDYREENYRPELSPFMSEKERDIRTERTSPKYIAEVDRIGAEAEKARREPRYVVPQLDAQGNFIGYNELPPGTKPTSFAKPPSSSTKGILSTPQQQAAYDLYEEARKGLLAGLGGTNTGPIMGRFPAFSRGQQVAEQSVAAMAPVLKQLFRVAGEGVFTDRDQQLLLDMIPTRKTDEAAIPEIMANIDNIVKAKLGMGRNGAQGGGGDPLGLR